MYQTINFVTPNIVFGMNVLGQVGQEAQKLHLKRALLVTGPNVLKTGHADTVLSSLREAGIDCEVKISSRNTPEPTAATAEEVAQAAREYQADCIIGMGGGSVMDVAKMASALLKNPLKVRDYFGKEKLPNRGIPTIMIPTTAGTGAEVTKHAIFLDDEINVKKAVASSRLLPDVAIVDPMLTLSCPPAVTAASGIDAFLHAAEPFVSKAANAITDSIALDAIALITKNLGRAFADGSDLDARYNMSLGSLMAGLVLNNAGTSLVHALAYPIGGEFHLNHGRSLTPILLSCFDYIMVARADKFIRMAEVMGENVEGLAPRAAARLALDAIEDLLVKCELPTCLNDCGITDTARADSWAVDGHAEQRLLSRCARTLTVEDCKKIYLNSFKR